MIRNTRKCIYIENISSEVLAKSENFIRHVQTKLSQNLNKAIGLNYFLSYSALNSSQLLYKTFFIQTYGKVRKYSPKMTKIFTAGMLFTKFHACALTYA